MIADGSKSQEQLLWCAIAVAAILFVVGSTAVVGFVWWKRKSAAMAPNPTATTANWSPATFSVHAADGVHQTSPHSWRHRWQFHASGLEHCRPLARQRLAEQ